MYSNTLKLILVRHDLLLSNLLFYLLLLFSFSEQNPVQKKLLGEIIYDIFLNYIHTRICIYIYT